MARAVGCTLTTLLLGPLATLHAATLTLHAPLDYQVIQRQSKDKGTISIAGRLTDADGKVVVIEARTVLGGKVSDWQRLQTTFTGTALEAKTEAPAGGWFRLEVCALAGEKIIAVAAVEHVGVGEVFVVAGQSNSANHGEEKQSTKTGKVATFDGKRWQLGNDPQPGASGKAAAFCLHSAMR